MKQQRAYQGIPDVWCELRMLEGRRVELSDGSTLEYGIYAWWPILAPGAKL